MVFKNKLITQVISYNYLGVHIDDSWYSSLTVQLRFQIVHLVQTTLKMVVAKKQLSLQTLYQHSVIRQEQKIVSDPTNILYYKFQLLPFCRRFSPGPLVQAEPLRAFISTNVHYTSSKLRIVMCSLQYKSPNTL